MKNKNSLLGGLFSNAFLMLTGFALLVLILAYALGSVGLAFYSVVKVSNIWVALSFFMALYVLRNLFLWMVSFITFLTYGLIYIWNFHWFFALMWVFPILAFEFSTFLYLWAFYRSKRLSNF